VQVFDVLASSPHAFSDTCAWNALTSVHAAQGAMHDAELAAARATEIAATQVCVGKMHVGALIWPWQVVAHTGGGSELSCLHLALAGCCSTQVGDVFNMPC